MHEKRFLSFEGSLAIERGVGFRRRPDDYLPSAQSAPTTSSRREGVDRTGFTSAMLRRRIGSVPRREVRVGDTRLELMTSSV
jgi:hypothetical protein